MSKLTPEQMADVGALIEQSQNDLETVLFSLVGERDAARNLLVRWADWARAHGHDVGMLDDTRAFLSLPNVQAQR